MLNIKTVRNEKGFTQAEVADYLSIARSTYTNIENGRSDPDTLTLSKLADFFGCTVDRLLGRPVPSQLFITEVERELLETYRSLSDQGQEYIRQQFFMAKQIYKKGTGVPGMEAQNVG